MNSTTAKSQFIYVIKEINTNYVKIGITSRIDKRLVCLQIGNPRMLYVVAQWEGTKAEETTLHESLADFGQSGEWFKLPPCILRDLISKSTCTLAQRKKSHPVGFKHSRRKPGLLIRRISGYTLSESEYGVQYLAIISRNPDRTTADNSVYSLAGYFNWKALEKSGLLRKEKKTK